MIESESPTPDISTKTINELRADQVNIEILVINCFMDYLAKTRTERIPNPYTLLFVDSQNILLAELTDSRVYREMITTRNPKRLSTAEGLADYFLDGLETRLVEEVTGVPFETIRQAANVLAAINAHMPPPLLHYFVLRSRLMYRSIEGSIDASELKRAKKDLEMRLNRLIKTYGFHVQMSPLQYKGHIALGRLSEEELMAINDKIQRGLISKDQMLRTLTDYGILPLFKYSGQDPNSYLGILRDKGVINFVLRSQII